MLTIDTGGHLLDPQGTYIARSQNHRTPALINDLSVGFGKWSVGLTDKFHLGFANNGKVVMYVHEDGDVWSEKAGGYIAPADNKAAALTPTLIRTPTTGTEVHESEVLVLNDP